ncbi:hypothetical protein VTL71DRAFT_15503 [Oculimacula yallundae]|uniref:Alpha/beta hydrolase fold-3 domain-containing protein n=1 Tax=Oculimacula yallundae TaxID=86028 RepID=A0ABR4CGU0_9HELO
MNPALTLHIPPPLDPAWLAHEKSSNLLVLAPALTSSHERQQAYAFECRALNAELLSGRDKYLTEGIKIHDTRIEANPGSSTPVFTPIRSYTPIATPSKPPVQPPATSSKSDKVKPNPINEEPVSIVIYYHGGGLYVGDLDSEDLTCRRICKELHCTVYSVQYRLMPEFSASTALFDALAAFCAITGSRKASKLIVMGSSSGGQLAAQVSQHFRTTNRGLYGRTRIHGVLLRGPVTCDATEGGVSLPSRFRKCHTSMSEPFHTSLLSGAAVNSQNRTKEALPLEAGDLSGMPRHWIQVSTNDVYYSDGVCYAEALRYAGVDVKLDVVVGWPHTFWLKAPLLERAVQAEMDMIEGLRWLIESARDDGEEEERQRSNARHDENGEFVPFSDEEFERKFMNV